MQRVANDTLREGGLKNAFSSGGLSKCYVARRVTDQFLGVDMSIWSGFKGALLWLANAHSPAFNSVGGRYEDDDEEDFPVTSISGLNSESGTGITVGAMMLPAAHNGWGSAPDYTYPDDLCTSSNDCWADDYSVGMCDDFSNGMSTDY